MTLQRVRFAPALTALLLITALITLPARPAAAASGFLPGTLTAYTDSAHPDDSFAVSGGNVPIGAWRDTDGDEHVSRGYYTFDLRQIEGRQITTATISLSETVGTDCTQPRAIEVWRVAAVDTAPTWTNAPAPLTRVGTLASSPADRCPSGYLYADVASVVRAAQAEDAPSVTLMLRIAPAQESTLATGRRVKDVGVHTENNRPPATPSRLSVSGIACAADAISIGTRTPTFLTLIDDPDFSRDEVTATIAYWPVDQPADRTELTQDHLNDDQLIQVKAQAELTNGTTYAWAVEAVDRAGASSGWTAECRFAIDVFRPGAPTVTSAEYPTSSTPSGAGIPAHFTFSPAAGDTDVVSYRWGVISAINELTAGPDGTATLEWTPTDHGPQYLQVQAVDRTGNRSEITTFRFTVPRTAPTVTDRNPEAGINEPRTIDLAPNLADTVSYSYRLNDGSATTVAAGADGNASIVIAPDRPELNHLYVTSHSSDGLTSGESDYAFYVHTLPTVTSPDFPTEGGFEVALVGQKLTLDLHPGMPGVTEYVWRINRGAWQVTPAGPDGTATVTWTERDDVDLRMQIYTRTADGLESAENDYLWWLTWHAPTVGSTDYPEFATSGGPGVPGTFTFTPALPGVTAYEYSFDDGPAQTIDAAPDGTGSLTWTPEQPGWHTLKVRESIGAITGNAWEYSFGVADQTPAPESRRKS